MSQWMSISEIADLYGKSRKWVYNKIAKYSIGTEKPLDGQTRRLQLIDFIANCGEPEGEDAPNGTEPHTATAQDSTTSPTLLEQENALLRRRIDELESDKAERQVREDRLHSIIERQTLALPPAPSGRGVFSRLKLLLGG